MPRPHDLAREQVDWTTHALFLDFDGTLVPIVDRPEDVVFAPRTREFVDAIASMSGGAVAIVTGRAITNLRDAVGDLPLWMSGSHGLELQSPDGHASVAGETGGLERAYADLKDLADTHALLLERKPGALALHYRGRPELGDACREIVERVGSADGLRALHGNCVSEVALHGIDKGTAIRALMERPPFRGRRPVMIGDDVTDEDGFRAAQELGGFGLRIGGTETDAFYRVPDMEAAHVFLRDTLAGN